MIRKILRFSIFSLLVLCCFFENSFAQKRHGAFDSVSFSINYLWNSNRNMFHRYWKPANGLEFQTETGFYLGNIEFGLQLFDISSRRAAQPDFWSVNMFFGWGLERELFSGLSLYAGFRIGNYYMFFDDDYIDETLRAESEFNYGLHSRLRYNISENISLNLSGQYQKIFTNHRIYLSYISLGLSKSFDSPKWFREFFN